MPEGVEVKLSADLIRPLVVGKTVSAILPSGTGRYAHTAPEGLAVFDKSIFTHQPKVTEVGTRGKFMYWSFDHDHHLCCTFGMTGQWSPTKGNHPCITVMFDDGSSIHFNDPRHFGTIRFAHSYAQMNIRKPAGWDPLQDGMNERWLNHLFNNKLSKTSKPIGQLLMDQGLFAGVGNYIRAEALYLAKMSPWREGRSISKDEFKTLSQALVDVMNESYNHQGATILTYTDAYGAEGKYSSCFKVYGQKTDPLGNKIVKEETPDKRTIHWCPAVQI